MTIDYDISPKLCKTILNNILQYWIIFLNKNSGFSDVWGVLKKAVAGPIPSEAKRNEKSDTDFLEKAAIRARF
jgi:hypothetical protein